MRHLNEPAKTKQSIPSKGIRISEKIEPKSEKN